MNALVIAVVSILAACESLPHDGPSAKMVSDAVVPNGPYAVVDLDYAASQTIAANPPQVLTSLAGASSQAPNDLIGPGDVLSVWIYQSNAGPALGSNGLGGGEAGRSGQSGSAVPNLTVDRDGSIATPFVGIIKVAGFTPLQVSENIRQALVGKVINPQVVVSVAANVANSVTVMGEVRNAGRFGLSANSDRLMDILAQAGGSTRPAPDVELTIVRGDRSATTHMAAILANPAENIRLAPHDQIRLAYKPRKFSTFGAFAHASQVSIDDDTLTLAGALSRMGGLNPALSDANSVMVFRFERSEIAQALGLQIQPAAGGAPVIYRLNLRSPTGYFVANTFEVQANDLIYVPQADSTEVRNFFDLVSSITRVAYDVSVTRGLR